MRMDSVLQHDDWWMGQICASHHILFLQGSNKRWILVLTTYGKYFSLKQSKWLEEYLLKKCCWPLMQLIVDSGMRAGKTRFWKFSVTVRINVWYWTDKFPFSAPSKFTGGCWGEMPIKQMKRCVRSCDGFVLCFLHSFVGSVSSTFRDFPLRLIRVL